MYVCVRAWCLAVGGEGDFEMVLKLNYYLPAKKKK